MWERDGDTLTEKSFIKSGVEMLFTLKDKGDMLVLENRKSFGDLVIGEQVHGSNVYEAIKTDAGKMLPKTDALMTAQTGLSLGVFTADCLAVYFFDEKNRKISLVHAGWRGIEKNIIKKAIERFDDAKNLYAAISPHIKKCCYKVGADVGEIFPRYWKEGFLDMESAALEQLEEGGLEKERISVADFCTCCGEIFFSYRRDKTKFRHLALIRLKTSERSE